MPVDVEVEKNQSRVSSKKYLYNAADKNNQKSFKEGHGFQNYLFS